MIKRYEMYTTLFFFGIKLFIIIFLFAFLPDRFIVWAESVGGERKHFMKRFGRDHVYERGQAVCELVAGLLGLAFIMIGVLAVALLGMQSIRNTVNARTMADENSLRGNREGNPRFIVDWNQNLSVTLSGRGRARYGSLSDPGAFTEELTDNTSHFHTHYLGTRSAYADNPFQLKESNLFVSAADLTFGSAVRQNVMQEYRHFDASSILRAFQMPSDFVLREDICMPLNPQ